MLIPGSLALALAAATATWLGGLEVDLQRLAVELSTIQSGDGGTRLVAFHLNKAEALALAGKDIHDQLGCAHRTEFGKQGLDILFAGVGWQIPDKYLFQ